MATGVCLALSLLQSFSSLQAITLSLDPCKSSGYSSKAWLTLLLLSIPFYLTQLVGDATNPPTITAKAGFGGSVIDAGEQHHVPSQLYHHFTNHAPARDQIPILPVRAY